MNNHFSHINVLIIDNNASMRQIMISMLRAIGFKNIAIANNQKQCLDIVASTTIDLIICGWAPPRLDALALLIDIRSCDKTITIPFIIVSSIIEQDKIKQTILNGVSEYLVPPFNTKIFEEKITKALSLPVKLSASNITDKISKNSRLPLTKKSNLSLLIVDDIADNIEIISSITQDSYRVKAALNAKAALKICLSDSPPDLILLDIMMPEVDGLTLCKQLKKNPITQNIVIIFLTALSETKDIVKGLSLGAVDYITKPIIPEIVMARLNVHSTLIFNQRAIQNQIDELLNKNTVTDKYNQLIQKDIKHFLAIGNDATSQLEHIKKTPAINRAAIQLNYAVGLSDHLIHSAPLLESITNNSYLAEKKKHAINTLIEPCIDLFIHAIEENNLEHYESFDFNGFIYCDQLLFTSLFINLYRNAVEAAPKGSRVSVEVQKIDTFVLIKLHNSGMIAEKVYHNFEQLFVTSKNETGTGIGVHLAYLIAKKMAINIYYHSSQRYGTTFYIKLNQ